MVISVLDNLGMTSPGAIIIMSDFNANLLSRSLEILMKHIPGDPWSPDFMIDKDKVEVSALEILKAQEKWNGRYWLCEFHNIRTWQKEIMIHIQGENWKHKRIRTLDLIRMVQRSSTEEQLRSNIAFALQELKEQLRLPNMATYLEDNWFVDRWLYSWIDLHRPSRRGLYNTDNASEAIFKQLTTIFLRGKGLLSLHSLASKIVLTVLPYYDLQRIQKNNNLIKRRFKKADKDDLILVVKAKQMLENGCILSLSEDGKTAEVVSASKDNITWWSDLMYFKYTCPYSFHTGDRCKHQICHLMSLVVNKLEKDPSMVGLKDGQLYVGEILFGPITQKLTITGFNSQI
jgi:hypothetical protein